MLSDEDFIYLGVELKWTKENVAKYYAMPYFELKDAVVSDASVKEIPLKTINKVLKSDAWLRFDIARHEPEENKYMLACHYVRQMYQEGLPRENEIKIILSKLSDRFKPILPCSLEGIIGKDKG